MQINGLLILVEYIEKSLEVTFIICCHFVFLILKLTY